MGVLTADEAAVRRWFFLIGVHQRHLPFEFWKGKVFGFWFWRILMGESGTSRCLGLVVKTNAAESEFAQLVHENVDLVFGTALRCLNGNEAQAKDVTQSVFVDFNRRQDTLPVGTVVPGWLYQHARYLSWRLIRTEQRRLKREEEAVRRMMMEQADDDAVVALRPVIDRAMAGLKEPDRDLVVLRFFRGYSLRETGRALGISEDAARMRVNRAVDRLRTQLKQLGVAASPSGLSLSLAVLASTAAPVGLAKTVLTAAAGAGVVTTGGMATATITVMKTKSILTAAAVLVGIAAPVGLKQVWDAREARHQEALQDLQTRLATLEQERADWEANKQTLSEQVAQLGEERGELFRLRGEVSQLRREKANRDAEGTASSDDLANDAAGDGSDDAWQGGAIYGHVNANLGSGETLLTGGWSLGEDLSGYLLVAAEINKAAEDDSVVIRTRYLEGRPELAKELGLASNAGTEGEESSSLLFASRELEDFLTREMEEGNVAVVQSPTVMARAGNQAEIATQQAVDNDGEVVFVDKQLRILPEIGADGSSVNLDIHSEWSFSDGPMTGESGQLTETLAPAPVQARQPSP